MRLAICGCLLGVCNLSASGRGCGDTLWQLEETVGAAFAAEGRSYKETTPGHGGYDAGVLCCTVFRWQVGLLWDPYRIVNGRGYRDQSWRWPPAPIRGGDEREEREPRGTAGDSTRGRSLVDLGVASEHHEAGVEVTTQAGGRGRAQAKRSGADAGGPPGAGAGGRRCDHAVEHPRTGIGAHGHSSRMGVGWLFVVYLDAAAVDVEISRGGAVCRASASSRLGSRGGRGRQAGERSAREIRGHRDAQEGQRRNPCHLRGERWVGAQEDSSPAERCGAEWMAEGRRGPRQRPERVTLCSGEAASGHSRTGNDEHGGRERTWVICQVCPGGARKRGALVCADAGVGFRRTGRPPRKEGSPAPKQARRTGVG